jgi:hypothetical protein
MKNTVLVTLSLAAGVVTLAVAQPVRAASITFNVDNLSGTLSGERLSGSFMFNDAGLVGSGDESLPVSDLTFDFVGSTFTEANAIATPEAIFSNNQLLGLSYAVGTVGTDEIAFSFVPGFFNSDDALFAYDTVSDGAGFGDVRYSQVPEASTLLGSMTVLGLIAVLHKQRKKAAVSIK